MMAETASSADAPRVSRLDRRKARTRRASLLGLLRMCRLHPERVSEATVDQFAQAVLRLLGVPGPEAARLAAFPLPSVGAR